MHWDTIQRSWSDYKASAKQQWSKLSDAQITGTLGKRENLSARVQEEYGLAKDVADRQISDWQAKQV